MATALQRASIGFSISAVLENVLDGRRAADPVSFAPNHTYSDGTGANQAKSVYFGRRTLAASATEDLDLAGGIASAFGNVTFTKIRGFAIQALATNVDNVLVGGATSNAWSTLFGAANDLLVIRPGMFLGLSAPDATGLAVTAGTGDLLKLANSGAGSSVVFDLFLLGTT